MNAVRHVAEVNAVRDAPKPMKRSNASVDETLADAGVCGQVHLPTGRTCIRPARHSLGCDFVGRDDVPTLLEASSVRLGAR